MTARVALCSVLICLLAGVAHGQEGTKQLVERLIAELHSDDARTRRHAARDIGKVAKEHPQEVVPALVRVLEDEDPWVRQQAVRGLWLIGPPAKSATSALTGMLGSASGTMRKAILDALAAISIEESVPKLVSMVEEGPEGVRPGAIRALGELGPDAADAVPTLIKELAGAHGDEARDALGKIGPAALGPLSEALDSPKPRARALAAEAHGALGSEAAPAVPRLIELLADEDKKVRRGAAHGLAGIGPPALSPLLDARHGDGSEAAELALEWLGEDHSHSIRNWTVIPRAYPVQLFGIALFTVVWFALVRRSVLRRDGKVGFGLAYSLPTAVACAFGYYVVEQHWTHSYIDRAGMTYVVVATAVLMAAPAAACGLRVPQEASESPASDPPAESDPPADPS